MRRLTVAVLLGVGAALLALLGLVALPAPPAAAQLPDLDLEPVAGGLDRPTAVAHAGDGRLFVAEQNGRVVVVRDGAVLPAPFLDIRDRVGSGGERGLLSLAFHPGFPQPRWVFVHYTDRGGDTVLSRFQVSASNPDAAMAGSEQVLLRAEQPFANHNGGQLHFGPDGFLYLGLGDGGSGNDPQCNAQDLSTLLGKVLRLDVDANAAAPPFHGIPADNPFVGRAGARPEIWSLGLRNPWRFSFDRATGDLYVADVGQGDREEVDFEPPGAGGRNYGWKLHEGSRCTGSAAGCAEAPPPCGAAEYVFPVLEYGHGGGRCSITGGYVYRGERIAGLDGWYLYGDFCSGEILASRRVAGRWTTEPTGLEVSQLTTFGEDAEGALYVTGFGGTLYRVTGPPPGPQACLPGATTLCLNDGRFAARTSFRFGRNPSLQAQARPLTPDTGWFYWFDAANLELMVKVLDGCPVNGRYWVFAAGLTDVRNELTVTDSTSGEQRRYPRPAGVAYAPLQDTAAFRCP